MQPVEYARLMGADDFPLDGLPEHQALFGFGDAVCVPVIDWIAEAYLTPIAKTLAQEPQAAAAGAQ
jgi:DNA (cytosine-5)-methyltransferase 1